MMMRNKIETDEIYVEIGEAIRNKLIEKNYSVVWFAKGLGCSRTNVYKIFKRQTIETADLFRISKLLGFDFFKLYSARLEDLK